MKIVLKQIPLSSIIVVDRGIGAGKGNKPSPHLKVSRPSRWSNLSIYPVGETQAIYHGDGAMFN